MFKRAKTTQDSMQPVRDIKKAIGDYFKADQLGPKNFENVEGVEKALETGLAISPLICWTNGEVTSGDSILSVLEVWVNPGDRVNIIPELPLTKNEKQIVFSKEAGTEKLSD